ncbi:hypothetical protein DUI87_26405 [Hirundo rustica rustica]|uniref:Uncharacterized protein n=1 Tax=Hirundo rustica rustica TaxID=333673 RepID=A0A3M0J705_HIRRU|nr:hypothetical protein DUI87_26405 [Hirundo rustica rustica]
MLRHRNSNSVAQRGDPLGNEADLTAWTEVPKSLKKRFLDVMLPQSFSVIIDFVQTRTQSQRECHLLLWVHMLTSLKLPTIGWLVPQPKANVWATLTREMGQDHICLSAASEDNPLSTCFVGIPFRPEEFPAKLLEMTVQTNCEDLSQGQSMSWNSPPDSFAEIKFNLPIKHPLILWRRYGSTLSPLCSDLNELEILGSSNASFCVQFMFTPA